MNQDFRIHNLNNGDFEVAQILPTEAIDPMLVAWGRYYGESYVEVSGDYAQDANAPDIHPIAVAMRYAPKSRAEVLAAGMHKHRGGLARRTMLGAAAERRTKEGRAIPVPAWAVDPVPCIASGRGYKPEEQDPKFTAAVRAVQAAWLALQRHNALQGAVLMVQYQVRSLTQADKAELVSARIGKTIGLKRYKDELRLAKVWVHARLA